MALCETHHEAVEELIAKKVLIRSGDVAALREQTLRYIAPCLPCERAQIRNRERARKKKSKQVLTDPKSRIDVSPRDSPEAIRAALMGDHNFRSILLSPRDVFKKRVRAMFANARCRSKLIANAFVIFDKGR